MAGARTLSLMDLGLRAPVLMDLGLRALLLIGPPGMYHGQLILLFCLSSLGFHGFCVKTAISTWVTVILVL